MYKKIVKHSFVMLLSFVLIISSIFTSITIPASAAVSGPSLSSNAYAEYKVCGSTIPVYRYSTGSTRGTCSPGKNYNAATTDGDVIWILGYSNGRYKISYPTSSGRRIGWVDASRITPNGTTPTTKTTALCRVTTYWANGTKAGFVDSGDTFYAYGTSGSNICILYNAKSGNRSWKIAYVSLNDYNKLTGNTAKNSYLPIGHVDSIISSTNNCISTHGWVFDRDSYGTFCVIHIYVGGPAGTPGAECHVITAKTYRPDVHTAYSNIPGKYHGWEATLKTNKSGTQAVYVYGINVDSKGNYNGDNVLLGSSTVTIKGTVSTSDMSTSLYNNSSASISCGFDGYRNTPGRHEGIDLCLYNGAAIYSLTDGIVTRVAYGSNGSSGLSTIAIYNESSNKTVIYLHSNPASGLYVGQRISKGQQIGTQGWRGVSSSSGGHTHVEVRDGKQYYAVKSVNDPVLENSNPLSFWNSLGYNVQ